MPGAHRRLTRLFQRLACSCPPTTMPQALSGSGRAAATAMVAACGVPLPARLAPPRPGLRAAALLSARPRPLTTCLAVPAAAIAATSPPAPPAPGELTADMVWAGRTDGAGGLTLADVGRTLTVAGWVHRARALGGKTFVDVRDATGLLQVVSADEGEGGSNAAAAAAAAASLERLRAEFVVQVTGTLRRRKDPNPKLPTGEVELVAEEVRRRGNERRERGAVAFTRGRAASRPAPT